MSKEEIKAIRLKLFMTQPEFAKLLGVSTATISYWETGAKEPRLRYLKKISELDK